MAEHQVYLSIGSNIGNRQQHCEKAVQLLNQHGHLVTKQSSFYETEPVGLLDQPNFINLTVAVQTSASPEALLADLHSIEQKRGRVRQLRWGARTLDLDILLYDTLVLDTTKLTIPHPLMRERLFVLTPLLEIAPTLVDPVSKQRFYYHEQQLHKANKLVKKVVPA